MLQFAIPCLLGLESLVGDEVKKLGLADVRVENGRVLCRGEERDLARLNINLRCGARVLLVLASFRLSRRRRPRSSSPSPASRSSVPLLTFSAIFPPMTSSSAAR